MTKIVNETLHYSKIDSQFEIKNSFNYLCTNDTHVSISYQNKHPLKLQRISLSLWVKFSLFFSLSVELQKKNDQTAKDLSKTPFHSALARLIQQLTTTPSASLCDPALNPYSVEQQPREQAIETNNTSTYNVSSPKSAAITRKNLSLHISRPSWQFAYRVHLISFVPSWPLSSSLSLSLSLSSVLAEALRYSGGN